MDDNGNVSTLKKGTAVISATVMEKNSAGEWVETLYTATVILRVQNEFTVSNYTLTDYNGVGGEVTIPTDMNIWYIGEEAFKDNNNITKIIIPSSVVEIRARAFYNCTALEEVYFVSDEKQPIADADLSIIYENAFYGCTNLKKVDFSNVKTITVAADCFGNCPNLSTVVDMPSIGTMHHRAFMGTALTSVDLTGLHMSGESVFEGCQKLTQITTGKFTAIGENMFKDCLGLRNTLTLNTPKIGVGAFSGCVNLAGVKFVSPEGENLEFDIGARAFENCGKNIRGNFTVDFGNEIIRSIGEMAFAGSSLKNFAAITGLEVLGENAFANTQVKVIYLNDSLDVENIRLMGIPFEGMTVTVLAGSTKYAEENGVIYNGDKSKIVYVNAFVTGEFTIPAGVTAIGDYAFAGSKVSKVVFNDDITSMGVGAFKNSEVSEIDFADSAVKEIPESAFENSNVTAIELPNSVTKLGAKAFKDSAISSFKADGLLSIDNNAFENCMALQSITLAEGIKEMGDYVFLDCTALIEAKMPSVEKLGSYTFFNASKLEKVSFGDNALTIGTYTFARTPIKTVNLGKVLTKIGEGAFYDCRNLESITLPDTVKTIEEGAFYGATRLKKVSGIENIEHFAAYAFYGTRLQSLPLSSAKYIGEVAFADGVYTVLEMPVVETIEQFAFLNGQVSSITLPATLQSVGSGAFAESSKLQAFKVLDGNNSFFAKDGVLYRYTNKQAGEYELVCYPAARAEADGEYVVEEGTVRILAYAFYGLNKKMVNAVVLPYSVGAIGHGAFYASGITKYTFESIQAPVLETEYRSEITDLIEEQSTIAYYKGYYYNNFETDLYYFTKYGRMQSPLTMCYPSNGKGYDNHVYSMYFGVKMASKAPLIEDSTRTCVTLVEGMPSAAEVEGWASLAKTEENKAKILAFMDTVKTARIYYNSAVANEGQAAYITKEIESKLFAVEKALRSVKVAFQLPFVITELKVSEDSAHKSSYLIGETFDMTGLSLIIVYDDYSTEFADSSKLELLTTGELNEYNKYVELRYEGVKLRVPISVSTELLPPDDSSSDNSSSDVAGDSSLGDASNEQGAGQKFDYKILLYVGAVIAVIAIFAFGVVLPIKNVRARKAAKAKALYDFEETYGEIHVNVLQMIYWDKTVQENNESQLDRIVEDITKSAVEIPEGGKVIKRVKTKRLVKKRKQKNKNI